jgi:hypothetical protein
VTVGGRITGVDENIRVRMRVPAAPRPLGEFCCRGAGDVNSPWSVPLRFEPYPGQVATIAAWTGGHIADVERFAVTAVRL